MKVRIKEDRHFYTIQTKKHWWSTWKTYMFTDTLYKAVLTGNKLLGYEDKHKNRE